MDRPATPTTDSRAPVQRTIGVPNSSNRGTMCRRPAGVKGKDCNPLGRTAAARCNPVANAFDDVQPGRSILVGLEAVAGDSTAPGGALDI
jgi:hypothetical protein